MLLATTVSAVALAVSSGILGLGGHGRGPVDRAEAAPVADVPAAPDAGAPAAGTARAGDAAALLGDRARVASRSASRVATRTTDVTKKRALDQRSGGQVTHTADVTPKDPRAIARIMLARYGFGAGQYSCLNAIYVSESGWDAHADNPSSSAYGIPQALPGSKMASAGADWHDNPATQIRWGLGYIKARYGSPCSALAFRQGHGWY